MFSVQFTTLHKVALLVALPVSGVLLYFLLRNNDEDDYLPRERVVTSRHRVIEVKVPRHASGAIIGTQGSQIKQIQETTGSRVNFKDDVAEAATERVIVIRGTDEQAQQAELMIRKIVAEIPPVIEETIYVPKRTLGRIIGKGGETVRKISRITKAKVFIDRDGEKSRGDMRDITLKGTAVAVVNAKDMIEELLQEEEAYRAKVALSQANRQQRSRNQTSNKQYMQNGISNGSASSMQDSHPEKSHDETVNSTENGGSDNFDYSSKHSVWPAWADSVQEYKESYISAVEHPGHFWIQLINAESPKLDTLTENMTKYYSMQAKCHKTPEYHIGDMVASPFGGESSFYRARVLEVMEDKIDLYFVDYGDSEVIDLKEVYHLRNDYLALPFQAFECCLANVESVDNEWSESAIIAFEDLIHVAKWKVIMAKRTGYKDTEFGRFPSLQLIDTNTNEDIDVAAELVRRGCAKFTVAGHTTEQNTSSGSEQNQDNEDTGSSNKEKNATINLSSTKVSSSKFKLINLNDNQQIGNTAMAATDQKGFLGNIFRLDNFLGLLSNLEKEKKDPDYWDNTSEDGSSVDTSSICKKSSNSDFSSTGMDISDDSCNHLNSNSTFHMKEENCNEEYSLNNQCVHTGKSDFDIWNNNVFESTENQNNCPVKTDTLNQHHVTEKQSVNKSNQNTVKHKYMKSNKHKDSGDKHISNDADTLVETVDNNDGCKSSKVIKKDCCNSSHVSLDFDTYPCGYQCEGVERIPKHKSSSEPDTEISLERHKVNELSENFKAGNDVNSSMQSINSDTHFLDETNIIQSERGISVYEKPFSNDNVHPLGHVDITHCDETQDSFHMDDADQNVTGCKSKDGDSGEKESRNSIIDSCDNLLNPEIDDKSFCFQNALYTKRQQKEKLTHIPEDTTKTFEKSSNIIKQEGCNDGNADLSITSNDSDSFQSCNNSIVIEGDFLPCNMSDSSSHSVSTSVDYREENLNNAMPMNDVPENKCVTSDSHSRAEVINELPPEYVKIQNVEVENAMELANETSMIAASTDVYSSVEPKCVHYEVPTNNRLIPTDYDREELKVNDSLSSCTDNKETKDDSVTVDKNCYSSDVCTSQLGNDNKGNVLYLNNEKLPFIFIDKSKLTRIIDEIAEEIVEEMSFREVKKEVNSRLATELSRVIFNEVVEESAGDIIDTVYLSELSKRIAQEIAHKVSEEVITEFSVETAAKLYAEEFSKDYVCEFALELSYEVVVEMIKEIAQDTHQEPEEEAVEFNLDTGNLMHEMGLECKMYIPQFSNAQSDKTDNDSSDEANLSSDFESLTIDDYDVQDKMCENHTKLGQTESLSFVNREGSRNIELNDFGIDNEEVLSTYSEDSLCGFDDDSSVPRLVNYSEFLSDNGDFDSHQTDDSLDDELNVNGLSDVEVYEDDTSYKNDNYKLNQCSELFMQQDSGIASSSEIYMSNCLTAVTIQSQIEDNIIFVEKGFQVNSPRSIKMAVKSQDRSEERISYLGEECPIFSVQSSDLKEELDTLDNTETTNSDMISSLEGHTLSDQQLLIVKEIENTSGNNYEILLSPDEKELEWDGFSGYNFIGLEKNCDQTDLISVPDLSISLPENCLENSLETCENDKTPVNDPQNVSFDDLVTPTNDMDLNSLCKNVEASTELDYSLKQSDSCFADQYIAHTLNKQYGKLESDENADFDVKYRDSDGQDTDKDSVYSNDSLNQDKDCSEVTSMAEDMNLDSAQRYCDSDMAGYEITMYDRNYGVMDKEVLSGYSHHQLVKIHSLPDIVKCDPKFDCFIDGSSQTEVSSLNMSVSSIMYDSLEDVDITALKQDDTFKLNNISGCETESDLYQKSYIYTCENEGNEQFLNNVDSIPDKVPHHNDLSVRNYDESYVEASLEDSLEDALHNIDHDDENIRLAKDLVLNVHFSNPDAMKVTPKIVPFSKFKSSVQDENELNNCEAETNPEHSDTSSINSDDRNKEILEDSIEESVEVFQEDIKYIDESDEDDQSLRHKQPLRCSTPLDSKELDLIDMEAGIVKNVNINNNNSNKDCSNEMVSLQTSNNFFEIEIENECTSSKAEVCYCASLENCNVESKENSINTKTMKNEILDYNEKLGNNIENNYQKLEIKILKSSLKRKKHLKNCPNRKRKHVHFCDSYIKEHLLSPVEDSSSDSDDSTIGASYDVVELKCVQNRYGQDVLKPALLATFDEDETHL